MNVTIQLTVWRALTPGAGLYPHLPRSFEIRSSKSENRKKSDARSPNRLAAQVLATGGTRGCGQCPAERPRGQRCLRALGLRNSFGSRPSAFGFCALPHGVQPGEMWVKTSRWGWQRQCAEVFAESRERSEGRR